MTERNRNKKPSEHTDSVARFFRERYEPTENSVAKCEELVQEFRRFAPETILQDADSLREALMAGLWTNGYRVIISVKPGRFDGFGLRLKPRGTKTVSPKAAKSRRAVSAKT